MVARPDWFRRLPGTSITLASPRQIHQSAARVDQENFGCDTSECSGCALVNFNFEPVRNKPHDAGSLHPWNLLELGLALRKWNKKNVTPNVPAHDFHYLRASDVLKTGDLNVIAGFNPEVATNVRRSDR